MLKILINLTTINHLLSNLKFKLSKRNVQGKKYSRLYNMASIRDYVDAELLERTPRPRNREAHSGDRQGRH
jgi:hypothetical protein